MNPLPGNHKTWAPPCSEHCSMNSVHSIGNWKSIQNSLFSPLFFLCFLFKPPFSSSFLLYTYSTSSHSLHFSWYSTFKTLLYFLLSRAFVFICTQKEWFSQLIKHKRVKLLLAFVILTSLYPSLFHSLLFSFIVPCPYYSKNVPISSKSCMPLWQEGKNYFKFNL